jgi:citrate lyase beta subunit
MKRALAKTRKRPRERQEGWDERLMVRFAFVLAAAAAALAIYDTVTWAAG